MALRSNRANIMAQQQTPGGEGNSPASLQEAFVAFRKRRQEQIKEAKAQLEAAQQVQRTPAFKQALREKFVEAALSYCGTPYSKKYHADPESEHHNAPLYLDCCGLVRKVVRDLRADFGFDIGRWNQAYQFDTLPIAIEREEDMKPGDLVFISGTYFNPKSKQQRHNMVHVEIWLGGGKTVGARYQRGVIQVHNSYKFVSKTYGDMQYYFRSLDTWLDGICKSVCAEHKWQKVKGYNPSKHSIFSIEGENEEGGDAEGDEGDEGDDEQGDDQCADNNDDDCTVVEEEDAQEVGEAGSASAGATSSATASSAAVADSVSP